MKKQLKYFKVDEEKRGLQSLGVRRMEVPSDVREKGFWSRASLFQFIYSLSGIVLGLASIIGGVVLFLHGVIGSTSWMAKFLGAESRISDAAPGVVLFIVGLFVIWVTRFDIKIKR